MKDRDQSPAEDWEDFQEDGDTIGVEEFKLLDLEHMPEDIRVVAMDNYFLETTVWREDQVLVCKLKEYLYTKFWEHKFSAMRSPKPWNGLSVGAQEGHPFAEPSRDDEDVHIFVRWQLRLPHNTPA